MYLFCNGAAISLFNPTQLSKAVDWFGDWMFMCEIPDDHPLLEDGSEAYDHETAAWYTVGSSNVYWPDKPWQPRIARNYPACGIFGWICDEIGASTHRNVAAVLGDICMFEGKTPIEFFNSLPVNHEDVVRRRIDFYERTR